MLNLRTTYPDQTLDDPDYPLGKARNETSDGNGSGTPFEERLLNDIIGFPQALVSEAGISPSNEPESVAQSDCVDALNTLYEHSFCEATLTGSAVPDENYLVTLSTQSAGWASTTDGINVPKPGVYLCSFSITLTSTITTDPAEFAVHLTKGATIEATASHHRYSTDNGDHVHLSGTGLINIAPTTTGADNRIHLQAKHTSGIQSQVGSQQSRLTLLWVGRAA